MPPERREANLRGAERVDTGGLLRANVPEADALVERARRQQLLALLHQDQARDSVLMSRQLLDHAQVDDVPRV